MKVTSQTDFYNENTKSWRFVRNLCFEKKKKRTLMQQHKVDQLTTPLPRPSCAARE